jgi:integrase/recombinase XerD
MKTTTARPRREHRFAAIPAPPPHPLLVEWGEQLRMEGKAPRTVAAYTAVVTRFAKHVGVSPVSACRADILTWFAQHQDCWAANTAGCNFAALSLWFRWLVIEGHRDADPMLRIAAMPRQRGEPRPITDAELVRLLALPGLHERTRVKILLAAFAGLRVAEIARVRGADVDVVRRVIWVHGKGRRSPDKTVPLHPLLILACARMPAKGWWFPSRSDPDRPMHSTCVTSALSRVMRRAGVSGTPHALRHWYGSTLLANGADLRTVQECLRHANIATTQIYTRVPDDRRHEAVDGLNPFGRVG